MLPRKMSLTMVVSPATAVTAPACVAVLAWPWNVKPSTVTPAAVISRSPPGASMIVSGPLRPRASTPAWAPCSVIALAIVSCSVYVPGQTKIVSPAAAAV